MLSAVRKSDNSTVFAKHESRGNGPFRCPDCHKEVVLHQGSRTSPHFSHRGIQPCRFTFGETEGHRSAKLAIYEGLRSYPGVTRVEMEHPFGTVRADVFAMIRGVPVAIEVQVSNLSPEELSYRTTEYTKKGIYVLWLLPWVAKLESHRYSPKLWERWLHAAYFGRVYYWYSDLTIVPYQFRDQHVHVERQTWKDSRGRTHRAGGYRKTSRRFKHAIAEMPVHLVKDFRITHRDPWHWANGYIPSAALFTAI